LGREEEELTRRYRALLKALYELPTFAERGWHHVELAQVCLQANDLASTAWHLGQAASIARGIGHAELLARVRAARGTMAPWARAYADVTHLDELLSDAQ